MSRRSRLGHRGRSRSMKPLGGGSWCRRGGVRVRRGRGGASRIRGGASRIRGGASRIRGGASREKGGSGKAGGVGLDGQVTGRRAGIRADRQVSS